MKPAIFNTEMVRAILDGRKTQTRRVVNNVPNSFNFQRCGIDRTNGSKTFGKFVAIFDDGNFSEFIASPYKVGDIIYVRETFSEWLDYDTRSLSRVTYKASDEDCSGKWKPSIHMPKEYARLFLRVKDVRIERLNEISEEDAISEGIEEHYKRGIVDIRCYGGDPVEIWGEVRSFSAPKSKEVFEYADEAFGSLWESIYGKDSFDNRYVWVIEFERISEEEAQNDNA